MSRAGCVTFWLNVRISQKHPLTVFGRGLRDKCRAKQSMLWWGWVSGDQKNAHTLTHRKLGRLWGPTRLVFGICFSLTSTCPSTHSDIHLCADAAETIYKLSTKLQWYLAWLMGLTCCFYNPRQNFLLFAWCKVKLSVSDISPIVICLVVKQQNKQTNGAHVSQDRGILKLFILNTFVKAEYSNTVILLTCFNAWPNHKLESWLAPITHTACLWDLFKFSFAQEQSFCFERIFITLLLNA